MRGRSHRVCRNAERGYVLLILLLSVAVLSIGFAVMIQGIEFQIKRDREEELIHRGVQYSRAVRRFIKAFGRYPNSLEELENTNNIRFLRKRFKDPITGKDFKILHLTDLPSSVRVAGAGGVTKAASEQARSSRALNGSGEDSAIAVSTSEDSDPKMLTSGDESDAPAASQSKSNESNASSQQSSGQPATPISTPKFGGGPLVGVASLSKRTTIREFNRQNHYNEWQFVYDPSTDRGGLLTTPNQPALTPANNAQNNQSLLRTIGADSEQTNPANGALLESTTADK